MNLFLNLKKISAVPIPSAEPEAKPTCFLILAALAQGTGLPSIG